MINPKRELFVWGPTPAHLLYVSFFNEGLWLNVPKKYPWPWAPFLGLFEKKRVAFICEDETLRDAGEKYFKAYFLNAKKNREQWRRWRKWVAEYRDFARQFAKVSFTELGSKELVQWFKKFYALNNDFWIIVHVPEIANWGGERILLKHLEQLDFERAREYLEILSAPVRFSFFQDEELALLKIAALTNKAEFRATLNHHAKKYSWILNSYGGNRILDARFFEKRIMGMRKQGGITKQIRRIKKQREKNVQRKYELVHRLKLSRAISRAVDKLAESIWWQDLRKGYIWRMHEMLDVILREIARRSGWKFEELLWCWPREIIAIASGQKVGKRRIVSRQSLYALWLDNKKIHEYYGATARALIKSFLKNQKTRGTREVRGLVVSHRKKSVRGTVKIIRDAFDDAGKMKKGDILVATMTAPEFIVLMRRAAAIVTDTGGMTSHAAIVSRELGIPCVVGTKIATQIFKDGDLVEVDAKRGIVRKIK